MAYVDYIYVAKNLYTVLHEILLDSCKQNDKRNQDWHNYSCCFFFNIKNNSDGCWISTLKHTHTHSCTNVMRMDARKRTFFSNENSLSLFNANLRMLCFYLAPIGMKLDKRKSWTGIGKNCPSELARICMFVEKGHCMEGSGGWSAKQHTPNNRNWSLQFHVHDDDPMAEHFPTLDLLKIISILHKNLPVMVWLFGLCG